MIEKQLNFACKSLLKSMIVISLRAHSNIKAILLFKAIKVELGTVKLHLEK